MSNETEWVLVPRKMTLDMEIAFCEAWFSKRRAIDDAEMEDAWAAAWEAAPQPPAEAHCATCACVPGMTPAIRFDATAAEKEGAVREQLIRMGWTPPAEAQPVAVPTVIVQQGTRVALVEGKPGYERIRCYWELPEGAELFLRPPPSAPAGVDSSIMSLRDAASEIVRDGRVSRRAGYTEYLVMILTDAADHLEALAQQPAPVAPVGVEGHAKDCLHIYPLPTGEGYWHCTCGYGEDAALAQQPAPVAPVGVEE